MIRAPLFFSIFIISLVSAQEKRVSSGLEVIYTFEEKGGKIVKDHSGKKPPIDLHMVRDGGIQWRNGSILVKGKSLLRSKEPPRRLYEATKKTNSLTVEAWVTPANTTQEGPARIVTFSTDITNRNFTLGQEKNTYDFRLRTSSTNSNGQPSTTSGSNSVRKGKLAHLIFTRETNGRNRLYINGKKVGERSVKGDFSSLKERNHYLALANEMSMDRDWEGAFHLVAIYSRALSSSEIEKNYRAGPNFAVNREPTPQDRQRENEALFTNHIAPILANHCLECHDSATQKGDLDLSTQELAFASIKPGDIEASELWLSVEDDEMPHKRPPLSKEEKTKLKTWIAKGAHWNLEQIDPANYTYHGSPNRHWIRRLTVEEYIATVKATVGVDIDDVARARLPKDLRADGFSNTAYNLNVDLQHIEAYALLASEIVKTVNIGQFAKRFSSRRNVNDKDMRALLQNMGGWVLRGRISREELDIYRGITTTVVAAGGDFDEAIKYVLEAMLQSPRFIYRIESFAEDASPTPIDGSALASRMSYIIWGSSPDPQLAQLGYLGKLSDQKVVSQQVRRMLSDPRAEKRALTFAKEWLNLGRLKNLNPNRKHYPNWKPELGEAMEIETLAFFREVVWEKKHPMSDLLDANFTYLTPELAKHYGIPYQGDGQLARHDLSKVKGRGGLLTQGSILTIGGDEASMVTRGLFILNQILRSVVKDPPPGVDTTPVPSKAGLTQRAIAEERIENKSCGGCHSKFEPLAFGLEKFDGLGAFHDKDSYGNELRDDGEILFPGESKSIAYQSADQLMELLAGSDRVQQTITWKLTQYAIGRPIQSTDLTAMESILSMSTKSGGTYHDLIEAIILSDLIQLTHSNPKP